MFWSRFVHEAWMTPSIFSCGTLAAEADIPYGWGSQDNARAVLERHWDTFITQSDFHYLASIGINTVRLPIGYWNLGPDFSQGTIFEWGSQIYANSWTRIKRAIKQAQVAGIGVLVDLHGAVGSQNGHDHSGVSDGQAKLFSEKANMDKTIAVLTFLMKELVPVTNVIGIQVLNEPDYHPELENFCE
jgi:glucan 1,3-beta-glucosidase